MVWKFFGRRQIQTWSKTGLLLGWKSSMRRYIYHIIIRLRSDIFRWWYFCHKFLVFSLLCFCFFSMWLEYVEFHWKLHFWSHQCALWWGYHLSFTDDVNQFQLPFWERLCNLFDRKKLYKFFFSFAFCCDFHFPWEIWVNQSFFRPEMRKKV